MSDHSLAHIEVCDEIDDGAAMVRLAEEDQRLWQLGLYTPIALFPIVYRLTALGPRDGFPDGYPRGLAQRIACQMVEQPFTIVLPEPDVQDGVE